MIGRWLITCLILCLVPGVASAEFYKYRDSNGVVRFTDNLLDVPPAQREAVEEYKEIVTPDTADQTQSADHLKDLNVRAEELNAERDLLAQEYAELEKERTTIESATRDPQDNAEYESYKQQVEEYNTRIKAYEEKRKSFQEKVDAFNADAKNQQTQSE